MKPNFLNSQIAVGVAVSVLTLATTGCSKSGDNSKPKTSTTSQLTVSLFAGNGSVGDADGTGTAASFNNIDCLTIDAAGNIYVGDSGNNKIRMVSPAGKVTTFAGTGAAGAKNGPKGSATFYWPYAAAADPFGNVYVADSANDLVRKIDPSGAVTNFSYNLSTYCLAIDASGDIYGSNSNAIFKLTPAGVLSLFAGSATVGHIDATGAAAEFYLIQDLAIDGAGNLYVADSKNNRIRKVTPGGVVTTVAGTGAKGNKDGNAAQATFNLPSGVAVDGSGNIYVADSENNLIRKIDLSGNVTTIAGNGSAGAANGPALSASFDEPMGITVDGSGNIYVADTNNIIRKISMQ